MAPGDDGARTAPVGPMAWSDEQVESLAPSPSAMSAARQLAAPSRWRSTGADERGVWGTLQGTGREPYEIVVDHVDVIVRCSCPSRQVPCKHALALLLLFASGRIGSAAPPRRVRTWLDGRQAAAGPHDAADPGAPSEVARPGAGDASTGDTGDAGSDGRPTAGVDADAGNPAPAPPPRDELDRARNERVESMYGGLVELDRWLEDRVRTGLADPSLADYATWDQLASRLVDAKAGSLANRIRRLAGRVGLDADWHDQMLAELGVLHLLAQAGRRLGELPPATADAVATTIGWQVRTADVLASVPETDHWFVAGRNDTREDRIEVRRYWLYGVTSQRWALVLAFAAYQQSLDDTFAVGDTINADLHRYPGNALRALLGRCHDDGLAITDAPTATVGTIDEALAAAGDLLAAQPWLDRVPMLFRAAVAQRGEQRFVTDEHGSVPLALAPTTGRGVGAWTTLLATTGGAPADIAAEWTPDGIVPLAVHALARHGPARSHDLGRRADASFVA
ncbi:MAG: SWIM zinc finger family protein [Actinomycetota bacterium]